MGEDLKLKEAERGTELNQQIADQNNAIDQKMKEMNDTVNMNITLFQNSLTESSTQKLDAIEKELEDLKSKAQDNLHFVVNMKDESDKKAKSQNDEMINNVDKKLEEIKESIEVRVNVVQKDISDN